jgi:hydrogenase nickel incorporation protein HypB
VSTVWNQFDLGKTSLKAMISRLTNKSRIAVIEGDVTTTIDSDLIASRVPTVQVNTGRECHRDTNLITKALDRISLNKLDVLFIEIVGNLICPENSPRFG